MKRIIDIDKKLAEKERWYTDKEMWTVIKAVQNGTPTPNATNGDVIKAMFPNSEYEILYNTVSTDIDNGLWFTLDWWNSPYQKGGKNEV